MRTNIDIPLPTVVVDYRTEVTDRTRADTAAVYGTIVVQYEDESGDLERLVVWEGPGRIAPYGDDDEISKGWCRRDAAAQLAGVLRGLLAPSSEQV